jgi:hypothetical protein
MKKGQSVKKKCRTGKEERGMIKESKIKNKINARSKIKTKKDKLAYCGEDAHFRRTKRQEI